MRRNWTNVVLAVLATILLILCQSCSLDSQDFMNMNDGPQVVGFHAGGGSQTRTQMLPNGLSADWEAGDELAVWARNSSGSYTLSNQIFQTYGLDGRRGFFTSELASAMPEGTYTYMACYPVPESVTGTKATFVIPSQQDGKVSDGADIMIATPVQHGELAPVPEPEDHSGMSMSMNRMLHQFRFWIPQTDTKMNGAKIERIKLTFPRPVAGNVQLDVADHDGGTVLSEGKNAIELKLAEPLSVAEQNFACVAFNPTAFQSGEILQVKAYTSDKIVTVEPVDLCGRDFKAGHSTPVKIKVTDVVDYPYNIVFRIAANNLGENPNSVIFTAPEGCVWVESGTNVYAYSPGREVLVGEEIAFRFEDEAAYRSFSGKNISVTYDSDHAIMYQDVTLQNLSSVSSTDVSLTVPYLFYEDFSGVPSFSDGYDNDKVGQASDLYKDIKELSQYTSTMQGWYATRLGVKGGDAARICCRYEDVLGNSAYYKGRLYTPFMSGIKEGADVNISVSFRYGGDRKEMRSWDIPFNYPEKSPLMYFGVNTQEAVTNPDKTEGNIIDQVTGMIAGSGFSSNQVTSLSPVVIKGEAVPMGGSYTSFVGTKTVTVSNVDNRMRLAWIVSTDCTSGSINANYWLYLDDIKVQIIK